MKFDDLLTHLGEFGLFQKRLLAICALGVVFQTWQNLLIIFTLAKPNYRCAIDNYPNDTYEVQNAYHQALINWTIPKDADSDAYSTCYVYDRTSHWNDSSSEMDGENATQIKCNKWVYDKSIVQSTITADFNIVCDNSLYRSHALMAQFVGMLIAGASQGMLSDIFGRKKLFLISALLLLASSVASVFINGYSTLIASRFMSAFSAIALYQSVFVLAVEFCGRKSRKITSVTLEASGTFAELSMTALAYLFQNWRHFTIAVAVPSLLLIPCWWLLTESPRWLLSKGRTEEAKAIVRKAAKVNGVELSPDVMDTLTLEEKEAVPKPWELFVYPRTAIRYSLMYFNWILVSMVSYGITLNVNNLSGNLYLNYTIIIACSPIATTFFFLTVDRLGRKKLFSGIAMMCGLALLSLIIPILLKGGDAPETAMAMRAMSVVGIMSMTVSYSLIYLFTAELWPTVLRNFGVGSSSTISRIGGILSPYVVDMGQFVKGRFSKGVPMIVFGAAAFLAGSLTLFLPETLGQRLPETIEDARRFGREKTESDSSETKLEVLDTNEESEEKGMVIKT